MCPELEYSSEARVCYPPGRRLTGTLLIILLVGGAVFGTGARASEALADTIPRVKPAVVAVGTYEPTRRPPAAIRGTGFVVTDGLTVVTNAHVLPASLNGERRETLALFFRRGKSVERREARRIDVDEQHDIAILRTGGTPLPAMSLSGDAMVREGTTVAFTGFPIGAALGLTPVTHTGIVSSITPIAIPQDRSEHLSSKIIKRLNAPFNVLQLDAVAYPGNSGSPVFDVRSGKVLGIVSMVFVKGSKEAMLEHPSGITYAIPVRYLRALLR